MDVTQLKLSVACCGLVCGLCNPEEACSCRGENHCGKRLSPDGCYQYNCCRSKNLQGCWECAEAPCGKDMLGEKKVKLRAFIRCIKEDGLDRFSCYLMENQKNGIVYHRKGFFGDYDVESEEDVLTLLRTGSFTD
jgi:hypothetical protein